MTKRHARVAQPYAIAYLRVSSELQENVEDQLPLVQRRAGILGLPIPPDGVYIDDALSRDYFLRRPGLQAMLKRAEDPNCVAVIVNWYNRLYTSDNQKEIFTALRRANVRLFDNEGVERNTGTHEGEVVDFLDGWLSKGQVRFIRKSVRDSHHAKALTGRFVGKPGYAIDVVPVYKLPCRGECGPGQGADCPIVHGVVSTKNGTVWVVNAERLLVLARIYTWFADGMTTSQVEKKCRALGYGPGVKVTKRGKREGRVYGGNPWSKANLMKMVAQEFYKGVLVWGKVHTEHDGDNVTRVPTDPSTWVVRDHVFGEIIPAELWERANANIKRRAGTRDDEHRTHPVQLWDGFLYCGRCGWKMHPHPRPATKRSGVLFDYYCTSRSSPYSPCVKAQSVPGHWLIPMLRGDDVPSDNVEVVLELGERPDNRMELDRLRGELAAIPEQLTRVKRLAREGFYDSDEEALEERRELDDRKRHLGKEIDELLAVPDGAVVVASLPEAYRVFFDLIVDESLPTEARQASLARVVERVIVDRPSVRFVLRDVLVAEVA